MPEIKTRPPGATSSSTELALRLRRLAHLADSAVISGETAREATTLATKIEALLAERDPNTRSPNTRSSNNRGAVPDDQDPVAPGKGGDPQLGFPVDGFPDTDSPDSPAWSARAPLSIWCDGSCAPNPGPGGWGAIIEQNGQRIELSGAHPACTNNIMEMTAAIKALEATPEGAEIHLTTDSRYVMDGITKWIKGWKRKGWIKADNKPLLNRELWMELDALNAKRRVTWNWVRGHSGHPENERCDELANAARLGS